MLLPLADVLPAAGAALAAALTDDAIDRAIAAVPDAWLEGPGGDRMRGAYGVWLSARRAALPAIIDEAHRVRAARV